MPAVFAAVASTQHAMCMQIYMLEGGEMSHVSYAQNFNYINQLQAINVLFHS